ncbi:MAG TPA: RNA polymerase sigma factor, partial [Candidatus Angelobacter sp.]|nr:RNA polymerase sigma factor [Candidatus Angelobacter sp.]
DVTQEVFMQLITNPKNYDPSKGSVAGYLFGIARNLTRRDMNKSRHQVPLEDDHLVDGEELAEYGDLLEALSQSELVDWLRKAILTLPDQYREVVVLCDLEELSYPEAGDILRCSAGTVGSRLHRARTMLRAKLKCQGCLP